MSNYTHQYEGDSTRSRMSRVNVGERERLVSQIVGAILVGATLRAIVGRGLIWLLALLSGGFYLLYRGLTGHCKIYEELLVNTAVKTNDEAVSVPHRQGIHVEESIMINRPVEDVYSFWRNFENLPRFMRHLESIDVQDGNRSHWTANTPSGMKVDWDAEIVNEVPNEVISWRSLANAGVANAGSVRFRRQERGTRVTVTMEYVPPLGKVGAELARFLGEDPETQIAEDLRSLKRILETDRGSTAETENARSSSAES